MTPARSTLTAFLLAVAALALVAGCGDDGGGASDAAPSDASIPDAAPPDSSIATQCQGYCADLNLYCSPQVSLLQPDCQSACETWPADVRACRVMHVAFAVEGAVHCLHAVGDIDEPSTPSQCVLPE
ncbi:hypothetical protein [Haliangium sp.]|uniref:hypothetical protein n=1 Tax=Haliangium sp. TaxID=2663208 RepID=UPI003D115F61